MCANAWMDLNVNSLLKNFLWRLLLSQHLCLFLVQLALERQNKRTRRKTMHVEDAPADQKGLMDDLINSLKTGAAYGRMYVCL
jgi:hypothetical protein